MSEMDIDILDGPSDILQEATDLESKYVTHRLICTKVRFREAPLTAQLLLPRIQRRIRSRSTSWFIRRPGDRQGEGV